MLFIKELFQKVDFWGKSADNRNANTTLHAKSVSLKCVFFNIALRCGIAIKTYGPLYNHIQLVVGHILLKVLNKLITLCLLSTICPMLFQNKFADHGYSLQCNLCIL